MNQPQATSYQPILTSDGSPTLIHPVFGEAYSSVHGAWMQANELYLKLTQTHLHPNPKVLEIGFGLGLNFRATLQNALERGIQLEYHSYELFPVNKEVLASIEVPISPQAQAIWSELLNAWPENPSSLPPASRLPSTRSNAGVRVAPLLPPANWGSLTVHFSDVVTASFPTNWASAIYFDPFSPEVNPEPWSAEVCQKIYWAARAEARLATYSVAGQVRRNLKAAGFEVGRVKGIGKKQWLVGKMGPS